MFEFSEPFYCDKAKHYLLILLNVLLEKKIPITLKTITDYFQLWNLRVLIGGIVEPNQIKLSNFEEKEIAGMYSKLDICSIQLNISLGKNNSLLELITKHKTILFSINSLKYPELAGSVGKIIIQDLKELTTLKPVKQKLMLF
ncbi:hypothetical protein [Spiroplasma citri]|uniref:hypothetical protein n=1 Tax=Spiroplasma citri TaxID=2133 RepID=UPI0011BBD180|nr:hypothetical protein [Spiroplasma citri]QED25625.1 hypothetical protein FRX96_10110 [Spiroplasma citri]